MKNRKLLLIVSLVLALTMSLGGTLAYLTDTDADVNTMVLGNVQIENREYERAEKDDGTYETIATDRGTGYKLVDFSQDKPLLPAVGSVTGWDSTRVFFEQFGEGHKLGAMDVLDGLNNVVDKFVFVENTGKSDAYIRTYIAYEVGNYKSDDGKDAFTDGLLMSSVNTSWYANYVGVVDIKGNNYYVVEYTYDGNFYAPGMTSFTEDGNGRHPDGIVHPGDYTYNNLAQVYLAGRATNEDVIAIDGNGNGKLDILVLSQAVQADGFADAKTALVTGFGVADADKVAAWFAGDIAMPTTVDTAEELNAALADGGDVSLTADITAPLSNSAIYGTPVAVQQKNGGVIDGNGNSLDIEDPKYEGYAIETYGGTIKNLTIDSTVGRGIVISSPKEDIYIANVVIDGPGYAINTTEHAAKNLVVTDSTIKGWTSFAGLASATFTNCTLGENTSKYWQEMGYDQDYDRLVRPYVTTLFDTCVFEKGFYIDLSALGEDCTVTLKDCTTNGTEITVANYESYISIELPTGRTLADCVIFQ